MTDLVFTVYGTPAAQGSKRHVGNGVMIESSKKVAPWRADVKAAAEAAIFAADQWEPLRGPAHLNICFTFTRPLSHYRTGRHAHELRADAPCHVSTQPDLDKCLRSTLDALTAAGVVHDDRVITSIWASKRYIRGDERPGAHALIRGLEPDGV